MQKLIKERDLKNFTIKELEELVVSLKQPKFLGKVIFTWIQAKQASSFEHMTNVGKEFRAKLAADGYFIGNLSIHRRLEDPDGTIKYLLTLADGLRVESVVLNDDGRKTLCVSSQVGCKMDCAFCATAKLGFRRNLTVSEILDQVIIAQRDGQDIGNVVFMGMGEPLDNYDNVLKAVRVLNHPFGMHIGARHITISTSGLIPGIVRLAEEDLQLRLAVSLHSHINKLRTELMPINKKYKVDDLIEALKTYQMQTGRRITIEYILLKDINDSRQDARGLINLLQGLKVNINLIEYNPAPGVDYEAPSHKAMKDFAWILEDRGYDVVMRFKRGRSIKAACGQLGASAYADGDK